MARKSAHAKGITGGGPKMCSAGPLGLPLRMAHVKGLSLGVDETAAFCVIVSVPKSRDPLKDQLHALVFEGVVENELQINLRDPMEPAGFTQGGGFSRDQRKPWRKHEKAKKRDLEKGTRKLESPGIIRYSLRVLFGKVSGYK